MEEIEIVHLSKNRKNREKIKEKEGKGKKNKKILVYLQGLTRQGENFEKFFSLKG